MTQRSPLSVGVVGLGAMGGGMAAHLAESGAETHGFDLSEEARTRLEDKGVTVHGTLAALAEAVDVIVLSLPKAEHVEAVCLGAGGLAEVGRAGQIVVDTTTSMPDVSRRVAAALAGRGMAMLDAPVSGGPSGAASGGMTMMVGGDGDALDRARPVLDIMTATVVHVGGSGDGNIAKIANNLLCAAHLLTTAEAMSLAARAGARPEAVLEAVNAGSGRSGVSQVNFPRWVLSGAYDSGFTMGLMRKDVGLAVALAKEHGLDLPISMATAEIWRESAQTLADGEDFNRIVCRIDKALYSE